MSRFLRLLLAGFLILLGTVAVLSAPFVRAEAGGRQGEHSVNSGHGGAGSGDARLPATSSPSPTTSTVGPPPTDGTTLPTLPALPGGTAATSATGSGAEDTDPVPAGRPPDTSTSTVSKVVYLTFDDGPHQVWTPKVLALLARFGAHATFFELGDEVELHPHLPAMVLAAGHTIGNHTYDHRSLPGLTDAQIRSEIARGPKALCLRPPYGAVNGRVRALATEVGMHIQLWDVDTRDWAKPGAPAITRAILKGAHDGAVILMHDGGGNRSETVAGLAAALPTLVSEGYSFRTVPGC